jgi:hypothetical protein
VKQAFVVVTSRRDEALEAYPPSTCIGDCITDVADCSCLVWSHPSPGDYIALGFDGPDMNNPDDIKVGAPCHTNNGTGASFRLEWAEAHTHQLEQTAQREGVWEVSARPLSFVSWGVCACCCARWRAVEKA